MSEKFDVNEFIEGENKKIIDYVEKRIKNIIRRYQNCVKEERPQDIENYEKIYGKFCIKHGISDDKLKSYLNLTDKTKSNYFKKWPKK